MRPILAWTIAAVLLAATWPVAAAEPAGPVRAKAPSPPAEPAPTPAKSETPKVEPKLVMTNWQSLYLAQRKIGYLAQSLYELQDGARRLQTNIFLKSDAGDDKIGYMKMVTADVDRRFRPLALECRIQAGQRIWQVKGRAEAGEFVLTRTVGDPSTRLGVALPSALRLRLEESGSKGDASTTVRIPMDENLVPLTWALPATILSGTAPGQTRRWLVLDESLGAVLPDPCLVHVVGPRTIPPVAPGGPPAAGTAVVSICGLEVVAHLVADDGRVLRSVWQTAPLVGLATGLTEARRLSGAADGPKGPDIEGLAGGRYSDAQHGFNLWVPPYPYVAHAAPSVGAMEIASLVGESRLVVRLAAAAPAGTSAIQPAGEADPSSAAAALPLRRVDAEAARTADLIQREWAARFEAVEAGPPTAVPASPGQSPATPGRSPAGREGRVITGTARLGCTTIYFRNLYLVNEGRTYLVSLQVPDQPVKTEQTLLESVVPSLRLAALEGPLPLAVSGDTVRSPYYGFELTRPSAKWKIPNHMEGPTAALELAREDQAAVVIVRVVTPKPGQSLEAFAAIQAQLAAENLGAARPEPKATTLAGRKAVEIVYDAKKVLSGRAARCTAVYTDLGGRVLALMLIAADDADESAAKDLQAIRDSLKLAATATAK